jgi:hypothetical protein
MLDIHTIRFRNTELKVSSLAAGGQGKPNCLAIAALHEADKSAA